MKIKHTLYLLLMIFSITPMLLFGSFMMYENDRKIESVMRENLAAISGVQILEIKNFCEGRRERMEMIARYEIVRDAVEMSLGRKESKSDINWAYLRNMLIEQKRNNSYLVSISIIDKDFKVVTSTERHEPFGSSELKDVREEYLNGGFFISDVYERETDDGHKRVVDAIQGVEKDGEIIGYVVQEIATSYFDQYRSDTNLWKDGTLYIVDGKNQLITAGNPSEDSLTEYKTTEEERESYSQAWNAIDHEKQPTGEITYKFGGVEYITYYSDLVYTDWSIRITANMSVYKENTEAYRALFLLALLTMTAVLIVVNYWLTKRLTRPINNIADTLKLIQQDQNYTLRVKQYGKDELAFLAGEVNQLIDYIEKEDIQEKERQRYLTRQAERDPLTGLKNKMAIEHKMQDMVQKAAENGSSIAVGFVDIDDFRDYNTKYGHQQGDRVLQFVASVLKENINGAVGRNGGDEFIFCVEDVTGIETLEKSIKAMIKTLNAGIYVKGTGYVPVPCSMGVVVAEGGRCSYSSLVHSADEAMYQAKEKGKNTYQFVSR